MRQYSFYILALIVLCWSKPSSGYVRVTLENYAYTTIMADFGFQFEKKTIYSASLMRPPNGDEFLCEYPESLRNVTQEEVNIFSSPIALLVTRGRCSPDQKARVGVELQKSFSRSILYMLIYNNEPGYGFGAILPLYTTAEGPERRALDNLGYLSLSISSGASMLAAMWDKTSNGLDPHLSPGNTNWSLPIDMEDVPDRPPNTGVPGGSRNQSSPSFFHLFRFFLFALLICAPFLRAVYLWRAGGGRISFRRSEEGRITGLELVQPQLNWFGSDQERETEMPNRGLLTEDQVLEMPEVEYKVEDKAESAQTDDVEMPTVAEYTVEERPESAEVQQDVPLTSCTMCSICIDEFEAGERIRLLPRCRHAFHTDCIMPWLTERHGSCPLCKMSVFPEVEESESESEAPVESEERQPQEFAL